MISVFTLLSLPIFTAIVKHCSPVDITSQKTVGDKGQGRAPVNVGFYCFVVCLPILICSFQTWRK